MLSQWKLIVWTENIKPNFPREYVLWKKDYKKWAKLMPNVFPRYSESGQESKIQNQPSYTC